MFFVTPIKGPIDEIQSQCNMVDVTYFVTKEKLQTPGPDGTTIKCNVHNVLVQWNPYIADTIGELRVGRYRGPAVAEGMESGPELFVII